MVNVDFRGISNFIQIYLYIHIGKKQVQKKVIFHLECGSVSLDSNNNGKPIPQKWRNGKKYQLQDTALLQNIK